MGNFLRSLFGSKKAPSKIKPRMQSRRLELLGLEERITPAVFSNNTGLVTIQLAAGESLTAISASAAVVSTNTVITINATSSGSNSLGSPSTGLVLATPTSVTFTYVTANPGDFTGISILGVAGSSVSETVAISGTVDLVTGNGATAASFNVGTSVETLTVAGAITAKAANISLAATAVTLGANLTANTSGTITVTGPSTLSANVVATTTNGVITLGTVTGAFGLTTSSTSGNVSVGALTTTGAVSITSTGTIGLTGAVTAASVATVSSSGGAVTLGGTVTTTGLVNFAGAVGSSSPINITSSGDSVAFGSTVSSSTGGVTISAATATKTISLAAAVTAALNSNILLTGDVLSNDATAATLNTSGNGNITITGKVDAVTVGNDLTLTAGSGAVTLTGKVGSSSTAFGDLIASGTGTFLASGTVNVEGVDLNQSNKFATSITFAKAVTATGATNVDGVVVSAGGAASVTFSDTITVSGIASTSDANITISSVSGPISVVGAITGLDAVSVTSTSGAITLSGAVTTSGTYTTGDDGDISIGTSTSGNVLLSGNISTTGTGDISLDNDGTGTLTINGNVSTAATSATNGDIFIGADTTSTATGGTSVTINGTVTTTGTTAGGIYIGVNGGTVAVNKAVNAGATGNVVFITSAATDAITIASLATITAGDSVADVGAGILNLGANITAGTATITGLGIILDSSSVHLTGAVSLKTLGTGSDITLLSVNGAQNLTLEAIDQIVLSSVGQTTALNTVTVTNSAGVSAGAFTAAKVVLTDTTGTVAFSGTTVITTSLTTAAKAYNVSFAGTSVLSGTPVFLNPGNVSFFGNTSLTSGATITGGPATNVNLGGTIVSGGAFNIGALPVTTTIANATQLILNSTAAASTFAGKVVLAGGNTVNLLGVGTLTLSGDSSTTGVDGNISVINGTLNVTGKIAAASVSTATSGTVTGAGGTIGILAVNTGTVAPGGILKTAAVTLNAATSYNVGVLSTTTASNLETAAAINLGNAVLNVTSVVSGLAVGKTFTIINNTAPSAVVTGTFAGLAEGATVSTKDSLGNTITFAISYVGGIGANDVTLKVTNVSIANPSAIPQPMVAGQPLLNFFTAEGAGAGGGPMVTVTIDIIPGLTTAPTYFSFLAYDVGFTGGVRVAINELDGNHDTFEIITGPGAGGGPNVKVFQFNIRTLTFNPTPVASFFAFNDPSFNGGVYVAGGDVTGDGIGDLLVGAGEGGGPRVQVYAGSVNGVITSAPISDFFAYSTAFTGGVVVAAGDRTGDTTGEVITGPASNGGYNIKSFNITGSGSNPTLIENFFAFNDFTSIGGLSIATSKFDSNPIFDLVVGTTNTQFGVILNQDYAGIQAKPFPGFTGAIRAGFASGINQSALAAAGPGGGPVISIFSVDPINRTLTQTDSLFVFDPAFTGGLFVAN